MYYSYNTILQKPSLGFLWIAQDPKKLDDTCADLCKLLTIATCRTLTQDLIKGFLYSANRIVLDLLGIMKTVLMVAEKPSLAQSITGILSKGKYNSRKGFNGACSIHEYTGKFKNETMKFKMTSVCGHVMSLDFHRKYNNWDAVDPLELFTASTLVLWLDCDKEGENICFEVIDCVASVMNRKGGEQTIFRAKFSAITEKDISLAMQALGHPNRNESLSVDARQELDLRIGCAFTRFQTKYFQGKYGDLDSALISYGPCQTPTLGFCVERHDHIQSFKPEVFWVIKVKVTHPCGKVLSLDWNRVRLFDKDVALMFQNVLKESSGAKVVEVSKVQKTKSRPQALNTVEMLRAASSGLSIGPQHAMQLAEKLYIQGYISYPRTETTHYPESFDLKGTLRLQLSNPNWGEYVRELLNGQMVKPKKGYDAGDHPPITPMKSATASELGGDLWRLYDFITRHFIGTLSPDSTYLQTTVKFAIGKEEFIFSGKSVVDNGFTSVMTWLAVASDEQLPPCSKDDIYQISNVMLEERQTSPPDFLTESELISLMEKHGIGTDASIAVHINNICERNYVQVQSGRKLVPTTLGIVLVHGYQKIDPELVLPTMRADVEAQLNLIAHGKADFHAVLHHALSIFTKKYVFFVSTIASMDELFEVSFTPLAKTGKPLSRCGKCNRYMKYIHAKPSRLHCATCDETYSLPQNGSIKLYKEIKCPLDDFELVLWSTGAKGKSTPVCPYCYNRPPFPDMRKGMGCNQCSHPTCPHSEEALSVADCTECEKGSFILDLTSAPKWRLACNNCNMLIHLCEGAFRISVADKICSCGSALLNIDFNKSNSPLPGNKTQHQGCVFCDPLLLPLMSMQHAASKHPMFRGGKRRGRGGRGRGRRHGHSRNEPKDKMSQLAAYFV